MSVIILEILTNFGKCCKIVKICQIKLILINVTVE